MIEFNTNPKPQELRVFAGGLIVLAGIVAWLYRHESPALSALGPAVAAGLGLVGLISPRLVRWLYVAWMAVVFPIGWVVSHLLLGIAWYGVVTPVGCLMRLTGRDPLRLKWDSEAETYWSSRRRERGTDRYFHQS